jgi:hypothetical protein
MKRNSLLYFLSLIIFISSCSSGKKALDRGEYYESVLKSIARLRKNSDHKKSVASLKASYPLALEWLEDEAQQQLTTNANFKWKRALASYQKINNMYEQIRKSPGAKRVITNPKNYYAKIKELKKNAAKESYNAAIGLMINNNREDAKRAYRLFREANQFVPGYEEVNDMIAESKFNATLKVIIEQIPVPTRYKLSANFFQDKVEEYLRSGKGSGDFVRFYTPEEARNEQLANADQILKIQFDDFVVGQEFTRSDTETIEKDSVEVGSVTIADGTKKPVLGTVKAKITTYRKEIKSQGRVSMQVFDANSDGILKHEKFSGTYIWKSNWGSYNGDSRALTKAQLKTCERKEGYPPPNQDMFVNFTRPIYNQLTAKIRDYYRNF